MNDTVSISAEIDLSIEPAECRVKQVTGDPWTDFGYWLEVTGFMAYQAMKYREWDEKKILDYVQNYIEECLGDYKIKHL